MIGIIDKFNNLIWFVALPLILISGLYFSFKLKFEHLNIFKLKKYLKNDGNSISPLQSLMLNLAARIGVGTISGVALAIYIGGVGTIFWMWITGIIASSNTFIESILGVMYQEKDENEFYKGGPSYYISKGLKKDNLAKIYSIFIILAFTVGFLTIQSNTITIGIQEYFKLTNFQIGLILTLIVGIIIVKGLKRIIKVTDILVPFMGILYFIICLIIILLNIDNLPEMIVSIFKDAFNFKAALTGFLATLVIGVQRGIFSNEAGIGTGAITAATVKTNDPKSQGFIQSFGVHIDTLVFGTLSALVVMCSNYGNLFIKDPNGIEISKYAFAYTLGDFGTTTLIITIVLFAFSAIISGYYYGETNFKFLKKYSSKKDIFFFKMFSLAMLIFGSIVSSKLLWALVDIFVGILAIINIYSILKLRKKCISN